MAVENHNAEVTSFDWSSNSQFVASVDAKHNLLFTDALSGITIADAFSCRDMDLATLSGPCR